jgi:predicted  nucleic acid-binding Zn-ribbon protein
MSADMAAWKARTEAEIAARYKAEAEELRVQAVKLARENQALEKREATAKANEDYVRSTIAGLTETATTHSKLAVGQQTARETERQKTYEREAVIADLTKGKENRSQGE